MEAILCAHAHTHICMCVGGGVYEMNLKKLAYRLMEIEVCMVQGGLVTLGEEF